MQHPRIKIATIAGICTVTIAVHGAMYAAFRRDVAAIVREQVRAEIEPMRIDVARAHERIDTHLAAAR